MDTDRDQRVRELRLQGTQLVEDVEAVDAATGPEVQEDDAPAQLGEGERAATGVQPAAAELRRCTQFPSDCWGSW